MKEVGKLFLGIFLLVFLSSGVLALTTCKIVNENACAVADDNYILLRLSAATNAHAQLPSIGTYKNYVVCCELKGKNTTGSTTCSGTNEVVSISATTNAHGESPYGDYSIPVCFEDFSCTTFQNSCPTEGGIYMGVLSLSATTNAHLGPYNGTGSYPTKICCKGTSITGSACKIKSVVWSVTNSIIGQGVRIVVTGSGSECNGIKVSFNVKEKDTGSYQNVVTNPVNVAFNGATATGMWYSEYQDDGLLGGGPEYVVNASIAKNPKIYLVSSNQLSVSELSANNQDEVYCASVTTCGDYDNEAECESDASLCKVSGDSSLPEIDCDSESIICGCVWDDDEALCEFGYGEIESCGNPTDGCTYGCTLCKNTTGNYCNLGSTCPEGEEPASNNNETCDWEEGCTSSDCGDGDTDTCAEGLYCLSGECSTVESPIILGLLGNCQIKQTIEKGCEEEPTGYKIITWTGTWTGEESGSSYEECIAGGKTTIPCAAQVELPFFDYFELVAALVVLAIIYSIFLYKKKHHGKKRK